MAFTIDGRIFDPQRNDQVVALGSGGMDRHEPQPLAHPLHLHVWPFTVLAASDATATTTILALLR